MDSAVRLSTRLLNGEEISLLEIASENVHYLMLESARLHFLSGKRLRQGEPEESDRLEALALALDSIIEEKERLTAKAAELSKDLSSGS